MTMLNVYFIKSQTAEFSPLLVQSKFSMSFNKPTGCGNILNFIQIDTQSSEKMDTKVFDFSYSCDLE